MNTKIIAAEYITPNVKRLTLEKPAGFKHQPGQAVELSIDDDGVTDERRPFTITSIETDDYLEFIIKIYTTHHGFTERLAKLLPGDKLILHEPFGSINYRGPGLFIAAGTGITPFIPIFRQFIRNQRPLKSSLLFANRTEYDVIIPNELTTILGLRYINVFSEPQKPATPKYIDRSLLQQFVSEEFPYYYICGPGQFVAATIETLQFLTISKEKIVIEE
ncbi:FAD-binding oxidoreductase [Mucilaginibacter sp. L3T2-6]|uniref:FAD-binding oxidoreductase n=1 Tax=Mucilaginibacter sp. L3T2-6 TaxID=3062491 RepID=UPI002677355D|nr:FAD-binding oxidoreductase [Mucilaginibacter sp. L3T2-6]MDO3641322.1 FAD-binding oxidoreductase [Mucilaginibacter sp. L3T2-6]MDV6213917.1 FAD-binding oxidoreductase [Mucilaginibacter sp. L3T2-6]